MTVCADMTKPKKGETLKDMASALSMLDYFLPNEEEACMLTGETDAAEAAEALFRAGVKHVVIKCGGRGCLIWDVKGMERLPTLENVRCVDTTGAGDSFTAGFLFRLAQGASFRECARFANVCGGRATEVLGATEWVR